MQIHSIETFGTHEGPGIRFVVFVQGCNYKCVYCHNVDTQCLQVKSQKSKVSSQSQYSIDELIKMIENDRPYFGDNGGVTVSGGEPLLQAKEIAELFKKLKAEGINTALDTNGSILNDDVKNLLKYTDLVLLDIKHIDPEWHEKVTEVKSYKSEDCVPSIKFAQYLESENIKFWIRYVLVPGYTDQVEFLEKMARSFNKYENLERIEILPYHTMGEYKYEELGLEYKLKDTEPPTEEDIKKAKEILEKSDKKVLVR